MKKDLGVMPAVFPMPVLMVAAYDENGTPCVMNAAWGTICGMDKIALIINEDHKTTKNITGNKMPDKFEKSGCHAEKSKFVNAPVVEEFPVTMECELAEIVETDHLHAVVGTIKNVCADENVLDERGKINPEKLNAIIFDQFQSGYYVAEEKVGKAWNAGKELMKAAQAK